MMKPMRHGIIKLVILLWALPMVLFWGWYALSINDLNFGTIFFSRDLNILVFDLYASTLGISPAEVRDALAGACIFDSMLVLAIVAWRLRQSWYPQLSGFIAARLAAWRGPEEGDRRVSELVALAIAEPDGPIRPAE